MNIMYNISKKYLIVISFSIFTIISSAAKESESIELEFPMVQTEDLRATKPSNITGQDVIDLLLFAGVQLTAEQIRNLQALTPETNKNFLELTTEEQQKLASEKIWRADQINTLYDDMPREEKIDFLSLTPAERIRLRQEASRDMMLGHAISEAGNKTSRGMFSHQVKGFHIEALVFYAAMGASMAAQAYMDSIETGGTLDATSLPKGGRADPRWMENFIHEMTSPIGLFSFFCFVIASGQTNVLISKLISNITFEPKAFNQRLANSRRVRIMGSLGRTGMAGLGPTSWQSIKGFRANEIFLQQSSRRENLKKAFRSIKDRASFPRMRTGWLRMSFGGQMGMAVGMLASNVVHEVHFTFTQNPHFKPCWNDLLGKSELNNPTTESLKNETINNDLHCDLFYEELSHTSGSWGAGIASLLTASLISHFLVNRVYNVAGLALVGTHNINQGILKGVTVRVKNRLPLGTIASGALWLVPGKATILKGGSFALKAVKKTGRWIGRQIRPGGRGHSLLNLFGFMLTDIWFTHGLYAGLITEGENANDVAQYMEELMKYHNIDHTTKEDDGFLNRDAEDYSYHDSVVSAHKLGLSFGRWRQFQMQTAMMANNNWFKYVSETLGSFEYAYDTYQQFFMALKEKSSLLHKISYFGEVEKINSAFEQMLNTLDEYIEENNLNKPEDLNVHVVSASRTRFLKTSQELFAQEQETKTKRNENVSFFGRLINLFTGDLEETKEVDRIFTLRALLSSINEEISIEQFYGDEWNQALQEEKNTIINYANLFNTLKEHFSFLKQGLEEVKNNVQDNPNSDEIRFSTHYLSTQISDLQSEVNPKYDLLTQDTKDDLDSYFSLIENDERTLLLSNFLQEALDKAQVSENDWNNSVDIWAPFYFDSLIEWLDEKAEKFSSPESILNNTAIEEKARHLLRKKIKASAIKYLDWIIERELNKTNGISQVYNIEGIPKEALPNFYRLGADNIFAKLYAKTFIKKTFIENTETEGTENSTEETEYTQILPLTPGMGHIKDRNHIAKQAEEIYSIDLHPDRLDQIRTTGIMDFFIVSALCGPDLNKEENKTLSETLLQKLNNSTPNETGAVDEQFSNQEVKNFMQSSPVFDDGSFSWLPGGTSYSFRPPRITTIDEDVRSRICSGIYSQNKHRVVTNIYNGHFPVGDKVYNNLLYLVLDHLNEISSPEEFESWWNEQVEPYYDLFTLSAKREYQNIVKNEFITSMFNENKKTAGDEILSEIVPTTESSNQEHISVADQMFTLTNEWIEDENLLAYKEATINQAMNLQRAGVSPDSKVYSLSLDKGVFKNIHFEALYWGDIILHYAQKTEEFNLSSEEEKKEELKKSLKAFAEGFNTETLMNKTKSEFTFKETDLSSIRNLWANNFLENVSNLKLILNSGIGDYSSIASILNIEINTLLSNQNPYSNPELSGSLSEDRLKDMQKEAIGAFSCNPNPENQKTDCERVSIPKQMLQYSIIRLNQLLEEASQYAHLINSIVDHPDVKGVTQLPSQLPRFDTSPSL